MNRKIHRGERVSETVEKNQLREGTRILREMETVFYMVHIFCKGQHGHLEKENAIVELRHRSKSSNRVLKILLCKDCVELQQYASKRLSLCRFGENKTTCVSCPVHCYAPSQRERIKEVMRYAGPRMLWSHPVLTVRHLLDGQAKASIKELGS
ncbi:hypothetical protein D3C76_63760 [compost metagenome]